jgi:putative salt-induced outer membrane protein YdiY
VNNDRYEGSFQWRRELGERTFAQSLTTYFQDDLKDINRNWEQNIGAGYRLIQTEEHVMNLGAGLTGQYREANFSPSGFYTLVELFQDYTYQVNKRITFRQDAQAQFSSDGGIKFIANQPQPVPTLDTADNYKIRFNSVLQGKITEQLSMNLRFEFEYDNAIRPSSARTDQRIISSLGYAF